MAAVARTVSGAWLASHPVRWAGRRRVPGAAAGPSAAPLIARKTWLAAVASRVICRNPLMGQGTRRRAVMPTHWFGFALMPHNSVATDPAMTIRDLKYGLQFAWGQCSEQTGRR